MMILVAPIPGAGVVDYGFKAFPFGTTVSYTIIFTKKQTGCNGIVKFSTHLSRVLIILRAILFLRGNRPFATKKPPQKRRSIQQFPHTGWSVLDSFFTSRMTTMYMTMTNATKNSVESTVPISAQAS